MPHWEKMLENYYKLMGWDTKSSKPQKETLKNLGLEHVIKDIW
jgi:aldehyde:ferredoxin oxidoreductase